MDCPRCKAKNSYWYKNDTLRENGFILQGYWQCIICGHAEFDALEIDREAIMLLIEEKHI